MDKKKKGILEFGEFRLDTGERRLTRRGEPVPMPPRVFDLLSLFVENPGRLLEKEELLKALWPDSFVEEANLAVNVSTLRRILDDGVTGGERYIETVPKRGYRFIAEIRQVPEPVPAAPDPVRSQPTSRKGIALAAICAVLAAGSLLAYRHFAAPEPAVRSLAVLPFYSLSGDERLAYLGNGMADAIPTRLSALNRIEVRPTSSVLKYSDKGRDPLQAGRELGVDAVLDGRVHLQDKRIRVTVQLLRLSDGKQLWADTFDDFFTNIFAVEDTIGEKAATALSVHLTDSEQHQFSRRGTGNTDAYRLYLEGQYLASKRLNEATIGAIDSFQKAVFLDPTYPQPYAAMANSYLIHSGEGFSPEAREKAKSAALKALSLDPALPEAHLAIGQVLMRADWDWPGAEQAFRKAISLRPGFAAAHAALATVHTAKGRHEEAIREMEIAVLREPGSASLRSDLSWTLLFARRFDRAVEEGKRAVQIDPWSYTAHRQLAKAYLLSSKFKEALDEAELTLKINGGRRRRVQAEVATVNAAAGNTAEARRAIPSMLVEDADEPQPSYEIAVLYARLGETAAALNHLNEAAHRHMSRSLWMNTDPELESLRSDKRFQEIAGRIGPAN